MDTEVTAFSHLLQYKPTSNIPVEVENRIMSATSEVIDGNAAPSSAYGVHERSDRHGNRIMDVCSQRQISVRAVRAHGIFDAGNNKTRCILVDCVRPGGNSKRKLFVVVDCRLPETRKIQINEYFSWCKMENLLKDYMIMPCAVDEREKTLEKVTRIIAAARDFGIKRRDLFVAIGSTILTDIVGFAAAVYRRSTPYIAVLTDLVGIIYCHTNDRKVSINHVNNGGEIARGTFALSHLPTASFYDPGFLQSLHRNDIRRGLAEIVKLSVVQDDVLFSYVEDNWDEMSAGTQGGEHLLFAAELAAKAVFQEPSKDPRPGGDYLLMAKFGDEAIQAIEQIMGITYDRTNSVAIAIALMSALSSFNRMLSSAELARILDLLEKAGLPIYDENLDADKLWIHMKGVVQERVCPFIVPVGLGKGGCLNVSNISAGDIGVALNILRKHCPETVNGLVESTSTVLDVGSIDFPDRIYERSAFEDVQYHVVSVPEIFSRENPTLIQSCYVEKTDRPKKKILIVVDSSLDEKITDIDGYFRSHSSDIDVFRILSIHVSSKDKNIDCVSRLIDAAIGLKMAQRDLFVVVGGGTLMDMVGFAAAIYKGGVRYVRIPTTLVGIIDAGVGVKVGVNLGDHKNIIGRYFAPIACLYDPGTFLVTLPRREFACGLAEAIKMAVLKSPHLFDLIERYHRNIEYNAHTLELIQISIRTMLEELQPNLHEHDLCRLVDFGHEFGHIVESLARHEIPHGECVAIGMAISAFLAHLKGILLRVDLERILNLILDLGLPIYVTDYDCCNPDTLWVKICTEGVEHKDGMLYLVVPESIGRASFLDNMSDINAGMVSEAVLGLRQYASWYAGKRVLRTNGSDEQNLSATKDCLMIEKEKSSLTTTAVIIGASGDIGSQLAEHLLYNDLRVVCSIRSTSLSGFKTRVNYSDPKMCVSIGDVLDLAHLRRMIQEANILYNMAGIVTLNSKPDEFARVIALNGFIQGVITHLIQQMGREHDVKVVFPSTQRVHLTIADASVGMWVQEAAEAYSARKEAIFAEQDMKMALESFAEQFIGSHPLPIGFNVYEISKRLGEYFVSLLPRHSLVRISGVYGPAFTRGFIYRAINPKPEGNVESPEKRDFIYIDDLNELLLRAAQMQSADSNVFDGVSGENIDLQDVWWIVRDLIGDGATVVFREDLEQEEMKPDPTFARQLIGKDFTPIRLGLRKTIEGYDQSSHHPEPIFCVQYPQTFKLMENEHSVPGTTLLNFVRSGDGFRIHTGVSPVSDIVERSLNTWFNKLSRSHQEILIHHVSLRKGLPIRLRADPAMTQLSEFIIEEDGLHGFRGFIDIHAGLIRRARRTDSQEKIDDIVGHEGYHLLAFLSRERKPLLLESERDREEAMAAKWKDILHHCDKPYVIVLDVGATYLRIGVIDPRGDFLHKPVRRRSPSKQTHPQDTLTKLQERLVETLSREIDTFRASHVDLLLEEVGISLGAVVTREGIVEDASILWGDSARGYDFKSALLERLPGVRLTILNDVSAAAWRYKDEGRFGLITVSSGLSNKVFNPNLRTLDKLDLDAAGLGGEMGHVIVEPRAVDRLVSYAISQVAARPEEFRRSCLHAYVRENVQKIDAGYLGMAVKEHDEFAMRLLEEADVPYCSCGNLADLCAYSSGRGALRHAQRLAARRGYDIKSNNITDRWLQEAIATGHTLALKVLHDSTYPLALRILQLAADIGLKRFIIVGGFAMRTGRQAYLQALQDHLVRFCHYSGFFSDWTKAEVRELVKFGIDDDNDGLIGMGYFVQHVRAHYQAVVKAVGEESLAIDTRKIPRCGAREVLAKVVFAGICTTDLQILRGERGLEPAVLGHEGVCEVLDVGKHVKGLSRGSMIVLNPNNPLDEHDKLGHTREGVFQQHIKFGQELLERRQVLTLGRSVVSVTDTLIEPLSCVVAAQDRIKDRIAGKNVLVVGAGLMGLLFVLMNVKMGARHVYLANRSRDKLDFAVAKSIILPEKVFAINDRVSSQVDEVSAGEGVDIVIIVVSLGQGVRAAQDAMTYVNAGGCVYLFAGFHPGDVLTLDRDTKVDVTSIRSGWKTEQIEVAGKPVDLSGHRGSRYEDLAGAADSIRGDGLSFGKLISHIIPLDMLPEIMLMLARGANIEGSPAKRIIVDMDAQDRVVESTETLPLRHLHEATRKRKSAISMGNLFREIGFEGDDSNLGWVCPPAGQEIKAALETALQISALTLKRHFIFVGTGGWVFSVDTLKRVMPASQDIILNTLQSLDPQALVDLLSSVKDLSVAVCLGISKSGRTLETVALMSALREAFDTAGLDYREHFVWLTDTYKSAHHCKSGEAAIRACKDHDWKSVDMLALTVTNHCEINALFCAPHSMVMFLTMMLLLRKEITALWPLYQQYLALRNGMVRYILPKAYTVASNNIEHIQLDLDESIARPMGSLVTQLIEQGLGSKQVNFNPRVRVTSCEKIAGFELIVLPIPADTPPAVKVLLTMNALAVFVAMVAYHRRIAFTTHPEVEVYKRKAVELMAAVEVEQKVADPGKITSEIMAFLGNSPRTRFVEILFYGSISVSYRESIRDWCASYLAPRISGISIDVVQGEGWNHSSYQAAAQTTDTLYVILVPQNYCSEVEGILNETVNGNIRMLRAIASATYETLASKALYFRVGDRSLES